MDTTEFIQQNVKCCISEKPLATSKHINMVQLHFEASWKFPVWGNFIQNIPCKMAVAYIHDDCISPEGQLIGKIKFAVEIDNDKITYHPVPTCRICGCTNDDCKQCIEKTGKPCHWVEKDLCSACQQLKTK